MFSGGRKREDREQMGQNNQITCKIENLRSALDVWS